MVRWEDARASGALVAALRRLNAATLWVTRSAALTAVREGLLLLVPYALASAALMLLSSALGRWPEARALSDTLAALHRQLVELTPLLSAAAIGYMYAIHRHLPRLSSGLLCLLYALMVRLLLPADSLPLLVLQMLITLLLPLAVVPMLSALMRGERLSLIRTDVAGSNVLDALNLIGPGIVLGGLLGTLLLGLAALPWPAGDHLTPWLAAHADPLPTALAMAATNSLLWFIGVHGYNGLLPLMEHAQLSEVRHFLGVFAFIGGSGATLSLVAAILLVCRHKALRMLAYAGLAVGLLGVNEVLLFGLPIILNPRLLAPFVLAPLVNVLLAWGAVSLGWVVMPSVAVPMTSPLGLNAYLATQGDLGAVLLQLALIGVGALVYAPFVRRYEQLDIEPPVIELPGLETTYSRLQEEAELLDDDPLNQAQAHRERLNQRHQRMREISAQHFFMAYQPKVHLTNGRFAGGEALLRYLDVNGQPRSAGLYVEWLREAGLIKALDLWVARAVVEQDKRWTAQGLSFQISINVTQETLVDPGTCAELLALLARTDGRVSVEITEDALIRDVGQMSAAIEQLHAVGAQVQIDDFGTGYSALSHLHRFPIDTIKIDRSFVLASATDKGNTVMHGVIALVQRLGLKVVVEGVETDAQLAVLKPHGDIQVQGWYFSQALAPDAFAAYAQQAGSQKAVEQSAAVAVEC